MAAASSSSDNITRSTSATSITTTTNATTITLGKPIFTENDKETISKPVVINGTHGFSTSFSGNGTIKNIDFTDTGSFLIMFDPDGTSDIHGHVVITHNNHSSNGSVEKATYTFQSLGQAPDINGTIRDNGAIFLHTMSSAGKLGSSVNNLVVIFKDQVKPGKIGTSMNRGWEWK
jgi:hypothetical protein